MLENRVARRPHFHITQFSMKHSWMPTLTRDQRLVPMIIERVGVLRSVASFTRVYVAGERAP